MRRSALRGGPLTRRMKRCPGSAFPVACAAGCDGVEPAHLVFRMEGGRTALWADGKPRRC